MKLKVTVPIRNQIGEHHAPPDLSTSADLSMVLEFDTMAAELSISISAEDGMGGGKEFVRDEIFSVFAHDLAGFFRTVSPYLQNDDEDDKETRGGR